MRVTRWLFWHSDLQNLISAGALPRTPLGEHTTLPRPPIVGYGGDTSLFLSHFSLHSTHRRRLQSRGSVPSASRVLIVSRPNACLDHHPPAAKSRRCA